MSNDDHKIKFLLFNFSIHSIQILEDVVDILNLYPIYVLQENYRGDDLPQKYIVQNIAKMAKSVTCGRHSFEIRNFLE